VKVRLFINFKLEIMAFYGDEKHNVNQEGCYIPKKKNKLSLDTKKDLLIDLIIDDLQSNEYESREYIYDLVKEALKRRTLSDLKQIVNGN
jgi:hypothetical protein